MVIQYSGELIYSTTADLKEQVYIKAGYDCYLFKVDSETIIDATLFGNESRFVNHSCQVLVIIS